MYEPGIINLHKKSVTDNAWLNTVNPMLHAVLIYSSITGLLD